MVLEIALLDVVSGRETDFERDFAVASAHLAAARGYASHELQRCLERPGRYALLVRWATLADHTEGFRRSPGYAEWKRMLHPYYDPFPSVEHFVTVCAGPAPAGS
jgi:heme-degrading monooxygenase HmoA